MPSTFKGLTFQGRCTINGMTYTLSTIHKTDPDPEYILNKLRLKSLKAERDLFDRYPEVQKFLKDHNISLGKLRDQSAKVITTGALTGSLLFANPTISKELPVVASIVTNLDQDLENSGGDANKEVLLSSFRKMLPDSVSPLSRSEEKALEQEIKNTTGVNAKASLEGEHLNTTYGYIGLEQHLVRYPGDVVANMAPGKGAWGYFSKSKDELTEAAVEREKWYVVVQTLYLPDWEKRLSYLRDWYKYRKVLVVNTINGNAVVGDIADSGPAAWTGKQFGGSPEVMEALGGTKFTKGTVLVFFVDDPENKIPLGPVDYNNVKDLGIEMVQV